MPNTLLKGRVPLNICDGYLICITWEQGTSRTKYIIIGVGRTQGASVGSTAIGMTYVLKAYIVVPSDSIAGVGYRVEPLLCVPSEDYHAADGRIYRDTKVPNGAVLDWIHRVVGTWVGVLIAPAVTIAIAATPLSRLVDIGFFRDYLVALFT